MQGKEFKINRTVLIIFSVTLTAVMGVASISPVLPSIQEHFHLEKGQVKWLISFFSLPGFFLSFFMGILADRYGRKKILIPSLLTFGIAGFLCSFATTFDSLVVLRFLQGMGAASLSSINITLIGDFFSGSERTKIMGYNASILSIGTAMYPSVGGALASLSWNKVFYLPLLAVPLALIILVYLKPPKIQGHEPFWVYFNKLWISINKKKVWGLFLTNLLVFVILYGAYLTFFPILLKFEFAAGPFLIGVVMSVASMTTAISSSQLGRLKQKFTAQSLLYFSASMYAASLFVMGILHSWIFVLLAILFFGVAHGLYIPNIQTLLVGMATIKERAGFMSLNSMILRFGQFLGPILIASFYINDNLKYVFWGAAGIALLMIVIQKLLVKFD